MIATMTDLKADLTIHTVSGELKKSRLLTTLRFLKQTATRRVLFDLREVYNIRSAASEGTSYTELQDLHELPVVDGGRIAFVFASETDYGIGRMYQENTKMQPLEFEIAMFQTMPDAEQWLKQTP